MQGLVRGADSSGRLTLAFPPRNHAMLLTKSVSAKSKTVRGVGILADSNGKLHYFRTAPFQLPAEFSALTGPRITFDRSRLALTVPPRSVDDRRLFKPRPIALDLPHGQTYSSVGKMNLAHIALQPLGVMPDRTIYSENILKDVLHPDFEKGGSIKEGALVEWSDKTNWTKAERQRPMLKGWVPKFGKLLRGSGSGSSPRSVNVEGRPLP